MLKYKLCVFANMQSNLFKWDQKESGVTSHKLGFSYKII